MNLSAQHLSDPDLEGWITSILQRYQIKPRHLKLEITESSVMANLDLARHKLKQLSQQGIRLCADDFGTGYSSLSYLHEFPIDVVKIDRSFVSRLGDSDRSLEVVRAVMALARSLKMRVVAEGVETPAQAMVLRALQCDYGQGYLFSKPVSADVILQLLQRQWGESMQQCQVQHSISQSLPVRLLDS